MPALGALLALALFAIVATEWQDFRVLYDMGRDQAFFNQAFYQEIHHHDGFRQTLEPLPISGVRYEGGYLRTSIFAGHFSPVYYLLLPFYAARPSLLTLLLIGSCAVAVAGVAVLLLARNMFGSIIIAVVWFVLFAFHPAIAWSVPANGFREVFLAAAFLGLALLFYLARRDRLFLIMLVLASLCKEDVAAVLPVWGVVAGFQGRGWRLGRTCIMVGMVYLVGVHAVVQPLLRRLPIGYVFFPAFLSPGGNTAGSLLHTLLTAPTGVLHLIGSGNNLGYWAAILGPLLFLPILGWEYLVIPAYVFVEISLDPYTRFVPLRYGVPAMPFIFAAGMVGASRLVGLVERMTSRVPVPAAAVRAAALGSILCGMSVATAYSTPWPTLLQENWPGIPVPTEDAALMRVLRRMPAGASLGATASLISEAPGRDRLIILQFPSFSDLTPAYVEQLRTRGPDYLAVALPDVDDAGVFRRLASVMCEGTYGVVYADGARYGRVVLARGVGLALNRDAVETLFPSLRPGECPRRDQQGMSPQVFITAARVHARGQIPSEVGVEEMFPEPVAAASGDRFTQVIHLPDQTLEPGWYRLDLVGAWPWWGAPATYRVTARVQAGGRTVGEVTVGGDRSLRYTTPPFRVDRRATLPLQVQVELRSPGGRGAPVLSAYRPKPGGCASIADAPSLNPRQVTVEAWIKAEGLVTHPGTESEAPILDKNDALGYYLRLSGDDRGKVWADFNVAGTWALGRVGTVPLGRWTLVTATYDGDEARIYLDGHPVPQIPSRSARHAGVIRSRGVPLVIGCREPEQPGEVVFPGLIASARVWNRVLTPQEIEDGALTRPAPTRRDGLVAEFQTVGGGITPATTNPGQLMRVVVAEKLPALAAWRARGVSILRRVTVRSAAARGRR